MGGVVRRYNYRFSHINNPYSTLLVLALFLQHHPDFLNVFRSCLYEYILYIFILYNSKQ